MKTLITKYSSHVYKLAILACLAYIAISLGKIANHGVGIKNADSRPTRGSGSLSVTER
jgi:hypothetical protein